SGKIGWRLGISWELGEKDPFAKSHFLAAPQPVNGKLYVLNETNQGELRLILLGAERHPDPKIFLLDKFEGTERFLVNLTRRTNAAQVVAADGVLVCP